MSDTTHRRRNLPGTGRGISRGQRFALLAAAGSLCLPLAALLVAYDYIVLPGERKSQTVRVWVDHTREVMDTIDSVMTSAVDAETGQRGFLLTEDAGYLEPYERSIEQIWGEFLDLQAHTADNLSQQDRLPILRSQLQAKLAELAATIDLARAGNLNAALDMVRGGQGRALMDAVRATVAAMGAEEKRLLAERLADQERSQQASSDAVRFLVLFGIVGTLLGGAATITAIWIASARSAATAAERRRLLNMMDLAPVMIRDLDGTIRFWLEGCHRLYGWTAEQAVGRSAHALLQTIFPVSQDEINADLVRTREWRGELQCRTQDGAPVTVLAHKFLEKNVDGKSIGVMENIADVSELRRIAADLRASEARLNLFIEYAPASIAMFDNAMCYLAASRRFLIDLHLTHVTLENLIGRSHYDVFPEIPDRWRAIHRRVLAGETLSSDAEAFPRQDGRVNWVRWEMVPWRQADGAIGGALLFSEDVSKSTEAEAARRENDARLRLVQKVGGIAYFDRILTEDVGTISAEFTEMFNLPPEQTVLALSEALLNVHPDDRNWLASAAQRAIDSGGKLTGEFRVVLPDGELRRISIQSEVFSGPDGQPYRVIAALHDVTEMATTREVLAAQRDELKRSNADLEEFTYAVSHDLRSPLRGIGQLAQWISEDIKDTPIPAVTNNLELLQERVVRMQNLLDGLLEYSRVGRTDSVTEDVSIAALISDIIAMQAVQPNFEVTYDGEISTLRTQRVALQVVLHNLISNAVKHHDREGGRIVVSSRVVDGLAEFRVSDDGPGIEEQFHQRIFGIFQTLQSRDKCEASGIGLAIVKRKVEGHGGRIWIESAPPARGTTFIFTWKASEPCEAVTLSTYQERPGSVSERETASR